MGIFDFLNPPAANIQLPQFQNYAPTGMAGAESGLLGGIGNLSQFNQYGQYLPQAQGITQNLLNNPYAGAYQQGAGQAGQMGMAGAQNAFGAGGGLYGLAGNIAQTAFDPQNDLYSRTVQQLQDQTRAGQAARGIATTPYGAGLENDAMRKFNTDWQSNQLQRMISGGNAAGGLTMQGAGLQAGAPGQYMTASGMPYNAAQTIGGNQFGALSNLGQFGQAGAAIPQQQISDWQNYLGWGTGAQNAANQSQQNMFADAMSRDKQAFGQQSDIFGGLGKIAGGLWGTGMGSGTVGSTIMGGLGSAGSSIMSALPALAMFSDERVKDDIVPVGKLNDGQNVYSYRYKGDPTPRIGLLAQEVERVRPDAVVEIGGVKAVDYGKATEWSRGISALSKWAA